MSDSMVQVLRDGKWVEIGKITETSRGEIIRTAIIRESCPHCAGKIWEVNYVGIVDNPKEGLIEGITGTIQGKF